MLNLQSKTFLQKIIDAEKTTFMTERIHAIKSIATDDDFVGGNVLYKIPINRTSTKDLIDNYVYPITEGEDSQQSFFDTRSFVPKVTEKVINIGPQKGLKSCLEIILQYKQAAGNNFYGAVLRKGATIINPFHVLSAISLLNSDKAQKATYSISLYFYTDRAGADDIYKTAIACEEGMKKNIDNLILSYSNRLSTQIKVEDKSSMDRHGVVNIKYREGKHPDEDPSKTHYIVTHQIVTQGIIAPYYGTSIIDKGVSDSRGIHVSPMRSCNISQSSSTTPSRKQEYGSVCTGRLSKTTLTGLRSLTHSNLSSPYNPNNLMPGFMKYVDLMIEKSIEIYASAGMVEPVETVHVCPYSEEEMGCKSLRDFLIMSKISKKTKLKPAQLEDKFNEIQEYKSKMKESQDEQERQEEQSTDDTCGPCSS